MLDTAHARVQAAEDTRRANQTIAARDAEIGTMRGTIGSVIACCVVVSIAQYVCKMWMCVCKLALPCVVVWVLAGYFNFLKYCLTGLSVAGGCWRRSTASRRIND
jgi:hypothetical protein